MREVLGMVRRTFARLDVSSRSLFALVEPDSCFAGTLLELALAADRVYMLDTQEGDAKSSMTAVRDEFRRIADGEWIVAIGCAFLSRSASQIEKLRGLIGRSIAGARSARSGLGDRRTGRSGLAG